MTTKKLARIVLVRHGESEANLREDVYIAGRLGAHLSPFFFMVFVCWEVSRGTSFFVGVLIEDVSALLCVGIRNVS